MDHTQPAYGLWALVAINSLIFILFAFSFTHPKSGRDWRSLGAFSGFIVALFTEMYGFPLTIYLLSGWLGTRYPQFNLLTHDAGHIWYSLLGFTGDPHLNPIHILSTILIFGGLIVLASAWRVLHAAQQTGTLATTGAYAYVRHPQYDGFILIMLGFLLQWPTLLTLIMFPILILVYRRLAWAEESDVHKAFGHQWEEYAARTPAFLPRLSDGGERHIPKKEA